MSKRKREADGSLALPRKRARTIEDFFIQTDSQTGGATGRSSQASTGAIDCDDVIVLEQASDARAVHAAGAGGEEQQQQQQQQDEEERVVLDDELHSLGVSAVRSNEMVQSVIDKMKAEYELEQVKKLDDVRAKINVLKEQQTNDGSLKAVKVEKAMQLLREQETTLVETIERSQRGEENDETERERLIRTGMITPFEASKMARSVRRVDHGHEDVEEIDPPRPKPSRKAASAPLFRPSDKPVAPISEQRKQDQLAKRKAGEVRREKAPITRSDLKTLADEDRKKRVPSFRITKGAGKRLKRMKLQESDDGDEKAFAQRLASWKADSGDHGEGSTEQEEDVVEFEGGMRIPLSLWDRLFDYQQTCVRWMWELHCQSTGGIIGDEMGLGKTIQTIAFLAGLSYSALLDGPILVVCPATVMKQWADEFHNWWPPFQCAILHTSGSFTGSRRALLKRVRQNKGVIITSYGTLRVTEGDVLGVPWDYVILDEGHKIKNPDAEVTLVCKQLRTPHRLVLTGAPIQNSLTELWSVFDFVFPGKLGTLPVFQTQFGIPIAMGGYANASRSSIKTAYKCAVVLRDLINPYLLRRMKDDVNINLPSKSEQLLFCPLLDAQRMRYEEYLSSNDVASVFAGQRNMLSVVTQLRKICNHPDLMIPEEERPRDYGYWERSGKMKVAKKLLALWKQQNHRVLLFAQTRQMLDIIESFVLNSGYTYSRMDGTTSIGQRKRLVDNFNDNEEIFVFLLTTRVGGVGVNLTSADRVLLFDPDWNPSTDMQARHRAWRIGQTKPVTIFRLLTSGTVEEKIYHRQIYKQFLTNKILKDPKQRRFFHSSRMKDLFRLDETLPGGRTETSDIFAGIDAEVIPGDEIEASVRMETVEEMGSNTAEQSSATDDAKILRELMSSNGIDTALSHDTIMEQCGADEELMSHEADRRAAHAVELLRRSRAQCQKYDIDAPTWTGKSGTAGAPAQKKRKRFGTVTKGNDRKRHAVSNFSRSTAIRTWEQELQDAGNESSDEEEQRKPAPSVSFRKKKPMAKAFSGAQEEDVALPSSALIAMLREKKEANDVVVKYTPKSAKPPRESTRPAREGQSVSVPMERANAAPFAPEELQQQIEPDTHQQHTRQQAAEPRPASVEQVEIDDDVDGHLAQAELAQVEALHEFLLSHGGQARTDDIVRAFGTLVENEQEGFTFRALLKNIASYDKAFKLWVLREDL